MVNNLRVQDHNFPRQLSQKPLDTTSDAGDDKLTKLTSLTSFSFLAFLQVKVVSEPERIDVFLTRSCAQLTVISCGVVYEATSASLVLFRSYRYVRRTERRERSSPSSQMFPNCPNWVFRTASTVVWVVCDDDINAAEVANLANASDTKHRVS